MGFRYTVPNIKSRPSILGSTLTVKSCCSIGCIQYFSLENVEISTRWGHQMSRWKWSRNGKKIILYKNLTKTSKVRDTQYDSSPSQSCTSCNRQRKWGLWNLWASFFQRSEYEAIGREIIFDIVVLHVPKKETNENERNKETKNKKINKEMKKQNSLISVIHSIQEDCGAVPWIYDNTVNRFMPIFVERVMLVDVPRSSRQTMVPLPYKEHLAINMDKIIIILKHGIELSIRLIPW